MYSRPQCSAACPPGAAVLSVSRNRPLLLTRQAVLRRAGFAVNVASSDEEAVSMAHDAKPMVVGLGRNNRDGHPVGDFIRPADGIVLTRRLYTRQNPKHMPRALDCRGRNGEQSRSGLLFRQVREYDIASPLESAAAVVAENSFSAVDQLRNPAVLARPCHTRRNTNHQEEVFLYRKEHVAIVAA